MMNLIKKIVTPRLLLRKFEISDAVAFQSMLDKNKDYMLPWISWAINEPETVMKKMEKIREWNGQFLLDQTYSYGIFINESLIGFCNMFTRQGKGTLEIGYFIDQEFSAKGYATECTYALTKLGFEHIKIDKLVLHIDRENTASIKIPQKLNYTLETKKRSIEKDDDGKRQVTKVWAMFIEEFKTLEKYEPVTFIKEDGW